MKGRKRTILWVAPTGTAVRFNSLAECARALGVHFSGVYTCMKMHYNCCQGRVIEDDGRPALETLGPSLQQFVKRKRLYKSTKRPKLNPEQEELWKKRAAYLEERRRMAAAQKAAEPDITSTVATTPNWSLHYDSPWWRYLNSKPAPEEQERLDRQRRLRHLDCTEGYVLSGFAPVICPVCGKMLKGTNPERHVNKELRQALAEGREFAVYPGGIVRVTKEPTGFTQNWTGQMI